MSINQTGWKDETSYQRGDKARVPSVWVLRTGPLRLVVHRIHRVEGWFISCVPFFRGYQLHDVIDVDVAKERAVEALRLVLADVTKDLPPEMLSHE